MIYQCKLNGLTDLKSNYIKGLYQFNLSDWVQGWKPATPWEIQEVTESYAAAQIQKPQVRRCLTSCSTGWEEAEEHSPKSLLPSWVVGPDHATFLRMPEAKTKAIFPETSPPPSTPKQTVIKYERSHIVKAADLLPSPITLWQIIDAGVQNHRAIHVIFVNSLRLYKILGAHSPLVHTATEPPEKQTI